ncbi:VanZ family protein [Paraclostridium sordellii]|uniref:VanZ family protein n=1 Tax=Paraclostridium sordellii TaxID=1505 RepID=UPI0021BAAE27|nr:VanZ family protein [Paeniclostridium sordellii]
MLCLYSTIFVEIIQLILPCRLTDIDDIILNFLRGYIGVLLAIKFVNYINRKQKTHRV